ncbi:patatin-like phospholipase family protein [Jiella sp. MQZ9-1]|uniref:Patatin-like phospholipase family protein n=1 Tax=Jiella flava TaxID=2816857 RepID=A0A939G155_9HYPH|nr:patatin-like phospholipase family protein [Jiella flava]MBO0663940.1 patatin-like phospholipase family protein [Jiella flava]MCD2472512.1 patatin-like phospholipase family protein [Jiella flava]
MSRNASRPKISNDTAITKGDEKLVLVFQGGGALGSYQGGAFEALAHHGARPDWVSGISIGAINCALIAGNPPGERVAAMRDFWSEVSSNTVFGPAWPGNFAHAAFNEASAASSVLYGVPGFFKPRFPPTYLVPDGVPGDVGFYDTGPLRRTLERLIDFDRLNNGETRVSLGAVNVETGNFRYFDSNDTRIGPEHVMASGALPPGFPPIEIDGHWYWDGGLVSNTPLQYVLDRDHQHDMCIFQVDLFSARGPVPKTIFDVGEREKDIRFSSRTRLNTDMMKEQRELKRALHRLLRKLPPELESDADARRLLEASNDASITIVHLIYRRSATGGDSKDYEFSRASIEERWADGFADAMETLDNPRFIDRDVPPHSVEVFDLSDG